MEFWGVEVKPGASLKVTPDDNKLIHISQAALGEVKNNKGAESVPLRLKIDDSKFVLGTLSAVNRPQLTFDLVFEKEFELSHDWKNGSVYLCGYIADNPYPDEGLDDDFSSGEEFSSEDEEITLDALENGKVEPKVEKEKAVKSTVAPPKPESSTKPKAPVVPKKDEKDSDDDDSDEDDSDDIPEIGSDDDMSEDDESDDDEDDEDKETPKKPVLAKKRPSESALKTPVQAKKAKSETPQKTDGKKSGGHTATPHPSKKAEKTPASNNKGKEQKSPKSAANIKCNSCTKTFNSEGALQSHSKAKHSAAK